MKRLRNKRVIWVFLFVAVVGLAIAGIVTVTNVIYHKSYPKQYDEYVTKYAKEYSVDENLIYAVIHTESHFDPEAVSSVGARGLMQIMDETYEWAKGKMKDKRELTYDDIYGVEMNIQYGTFILSLLLEEFRSTDTAVAAYHTGWGNVKKWLSDPEKSSNGVDINNIPSNVTSAYVTKVKKAKEMYEKLYS